MPRLGRSNQPYLANILAILQYFLASPRTGIRPGRDFAKNVKSLRHLGAISTPIIRPLALLFIPHIMSCKCDIVGSMSCSKTVLYHRMQESIHPDFPWNRGDLLRFLTLREATFSTLLLRIFFLTHRILHFLHLR